MTPDLQWAAGGMEPTMFWSTDGPKFACAFCPLQVHASSWPVLENLYIAIQNPKANVWIFDFGRLDFGFWIGAVWILDLSC